MSATTEERNMTTAQQIEDYQRTFIGRVGSGREHPEVVAAEENYNRYLDENYGPLWGEEQQRTANTLTADLQRAYERHAVDENERIAL
jgi:hypothetical protein